MRIVSGAVGAKVQLSRAARLILMGCGPPTGICTILFTSNVVGIVFARSLHYQFYAWYAHQVVFLLWQAPFELPHRSVSKQPPPHNIQDRQTSDSRVALLCWQGWAAGCDRVGVERVPVDGAVEPDGDGDQLCVGGGGADGWGRGRVRGGPGGGEAKGSGRGGEGEGGVSQWLQLRRAAASMV